MLRKLAGMADLEGSLKKLDRLTQEEARMALAEVLRLTHSVRDEVKVVGGNVESMGDKVEDIGGQVEDIGDQVKGISNQVEDIGDQVEDIGDKVDDIGNKADDLGDTVKCVDEKVQEVMNSARAVSIQSPIPSKILTFRLQRSKSSSARNNFDHSAGSGHYRRSQVFATP